MWSLILQSFSIPSQADLTHTEANKLEMERSGKKSVFEMVLSKTCLCYFFAGWCGMNRNAQVYIWHPFRRDVLRVPQSICKHTYCRYQFDASPTILQLPISLKKNPRQRKRLARSPGVFDFTLITVFFMGKSKRTPTYPWSIPQASPNPQMKGIPS